VPEAVAPADTNAYSARAKACGNAQPGARHAVERPVMGTGDDQAFGLGFGSVRHVNLPDRANPAGRLGFPDQPVRAAVSANIGGVKASGRISATETVMAPKPQA